ncbi:MAG: nucleotidyltransferase family protein [Chloroflexi bacterium]|nr:nucleotidyltransferase family protein [Chloroflexota bacterium]
MTSERAALIARKNETIRELAGIRRRLEAAQQAADSGAHPDRLSFLQAEFGRLQAEEAQLRLAIDRAPHPPLTLPAPSRVAEQEQPMQEKFDVFIAAGYDPDKADPLLEAAGVDHKSLVPVAGKPMIWHVVRAFVESGRVGKIVIVGLGPEHGLDFGAPVHYVPNQPSLWASQNAGVRRLQEINPDDRFIIGTTADIPLLTGEIVGWFVEHCQPFDRELYWGIVPEDVMVRGFPDSKRSYLPLREGRFCSGDLYLGKLSTALHIQTKIRSFIETRKNVVRQLWLLGPAIILRFLFRRLSLDDMLGVAQRVFGITGGPVILPFAEVGMDVDKPFQWEQVVDYLARHPEHPVNGKEKGRREEGMM